MLHTLRYWALQSTRWCLSQIYKVFGKVWLQFFGHSNTLRLWHLIALGPLPVRLMHWVPSLTVCMYFNVCSSMAAHKPNALGECPGSPKMCHCLA